MSSKNKKQRKGNRSGAAAEEGNQMIEDPRFSSAHTDPRFRRLPRRESKVQIDSRFQSVLTDKPSAPVDKRGKRRSKESGKEDSLKEFYRIEEEEEEKPKKDDSDENESEEEEDSKIDNNNNNNNNNNKKKKKKLDLMKVASSDDEESDSVEEEEEEEEEDTDEDDDDAIYDEPEVPEEEIPNIEKETNRLAIVGMDWRHVSAKDLFAILNSSLPKDGSILSVAVYPTEFGIERMKQENIHGPAIDLPKKKEDDDDYEEDEEEEEEEEEDEDVINEKFRDYEKSKLKYYYAVVECNSVATADHLYKECDGLEIERSSVKLDLRFIPDSLTFEHPPRDIATEIPSDYKGLNFENRALQMSNVNLSWDEDEPHRTKTLNQKFNPDQLAELELKEFLASSDDSEPEDDRDDEENEEEKRKEKSKREEKEKRKQKYRALVESVDVDSDKDSEEDEDENDQDMEVTFNTGLEDLSKHILEKKDKKSESVWEAYLNQRREKKRARKNNKKNNGDDDDDSDDDYNVDRKVVNDDDDDDFFMDEERPRKKKKKEEKLKRNKKKDEEVVEAEEKSRAELELLLADENAGGGRGEDGNNSLKGYNIKKKNKKSSKEITEDMLPSADPRFSAALFSPDFALDPTDPQFKRSATYARKINEDPRKQREVVEVKGKGKAELNSEDGNLKSTKEKKHELNSSVKSLKMKLNALSKKK